MCEILVVKHNSKGLKFDVGAIKEALKSNSDSYGYMVLQKNKKGYDLIETDKSTLPKERPICVNGRIDFNVYTSYELLPDRKALELETDNGSIMRYQFPNFDKVYLLPSQDIRTEVEKWLVKKKIKYNFDYINSSLDTGYSLPMSNIDFDIAANKLYDRQLKLEKNQLMIMHFRLATIGGGDSNAQPIAIDNLMVIHNGVFTGFGSSTKSDTNVLTSYLSHIYDLSSVSPDDEYIFFESLLSLVEGWFSIFIYSKRSKRLHYYRNKASFHSYANNIMYSTKTERFPNSTKMVDSFI